MRQAVILAGGKGTRLRERLKGLPKPLIDIGGVPLLERQVALCKRYGIQNILILVNHAAEKIVSFCASNKNWGLNIQCLDDGDPRGTAGAVLAAYDRLEDEFFVIYGDTMLDVDLLRFHSFHRAQPAAASLFIHPNDHPEDSDLVAVDTEDRIIAIHPYPHDPSHFYANRVSAGLHIVNKFSLENWREVSGVTDFGKDLFSRMLAAGQTLRAYNSPEYIKDCGTPKRLDKVRADLANGRIERCCLDRPQTAVFIMRDVIAGDAEPASAIQRLNGSECRTVMLAPVANAETQLLHNTLETQLGRRGAYIDRIYCGEDGIRRAIADLNIDPLKSWLVGDNAAALTAAQQAGLSSILVETEIDERQMVLPDFTVPEFDAATAFILDEYPKLASWLRDWMQGIAAGGTIFIGGLARSGKTTVAQSLRREFLAQGRPCTVLSIDRWLLSKTDRGAGVAARYDLPALQLLVTRLTARKEAFDLDLPFYDKLNRRRIEGSERVSIAPGDIVIIEGTIALKLAEGLQNTIRTLHVETDEALRYARFLQEYQMRGEIDADIEAVYNSRQADETPIVETLAVLAQTRLTLPLAGRDPTQGQYAHAHGH